MDELTDMERLAMVRESWGSIVTFLQWLHNTKGVALCQVVDTEFNDFVPVVTELSAYLGEFFGLDFERAIAQIAGYQTAAERQAAAGGAS